MLNLNHNAGKALIEDSTLHQYFEKVSSSLLDTPFASARFDPRRLAEDIQRLSDQYISKHKDLSSIWQDNALASAYVHYYMPLNLLRLIGVFREAQSRHFFDGLSHVVDFGSGPGTAEWAATECQQKFSSWTFVEKSEEAVAWHKNLRSKIFSNDGSRPGATSQSDATSRPNATPQPNATWTTKINSPPPPGTLALFSYSLNELEQLPNSAFKADALLIVEPSTQVHGRQLQKWRERLIELGFFAWAPCTHQDKCPLLAHSKNDWCHHRIHVELPSWLREVERHLPMKNETLTYSYLLLRKTPPPVTAKVRVIGDTLYEKGKVRQAICRGPQREFITWLTRQGEPQPLQRGSLFLLPGNALKKGSEIRMPFSDESPAPTD